VTLIASSSLALEVLDVDLTIDDPAYGCQANPITADLLRGRELSCVTGGSSLAFVIDPR